jgi:hypothetical protein
MDSSLASSVRLSVLVGWALGAVGCSQGSVLTYNTKGYDSGDTAYVGTTDGGDTEDIIEQDPVYDDTAEDSGDTSPPDPVYTWSRWTGERRYEIDKSDPREADCTGETVTETGVRIETDLEALQDLCFACSDFYEVTYASRSACGGDIDLSTPEIRGIVQRGTNLEVWRIREDVPEPDVEFEFNDAPYSDGRATFAFSYTWNGEGTVNVSGFLQFDEEPAP